MRGPIALLAVSTLALIGVIATLIETGKPADCPAASGRSVESLFAPCLQPHATDNAQHSLYQRHANAVRR